MHRIKVMDGKQRNVEVKKRMNMRETKVRREKRQRA